MTLRVRYEFWYFEAIKQLMRNYQIVRFMGSAETTQDEWFMLSSLCT